MEATAVAALVARVQRCGRSVVHWDAAAVYRLARAFDVSVRARGNELDIVGPRDACHFLFPAVRHHKRALLAGACAVCRLELATHGARCAWCDVVTGRRVVYAPDSEAERAFLAALATASARAGEAPEVRSGESRRDAA